MGKAIIKAIKICLISLTIYLFLSYLFIFTVQKYEEFFISRKKLERIRIILAFDRRSTKSLGQCRLQAGGTAPGAPYAPE
jgi:hypothetical protein